MRVKAAGYVVFDTYGGEVMGCGYTQAKAYEDALLHHFGPSGTEEERKSFCLGLTAMRATWDFIEEAETEGADYNHEIDGILCTSNEYWEGRR